MKQIALALSLALCALPSLAEEAGNSDIEKGASLLEQGARLFFKGLMAEMEPALSEMGDDMEEFARTMQPAMRDLTRLLGDLSKYHAPEVLPNGDIIIRRKLPGEMPPEAEIDL